MKHQTDLDTLRGGAGRASKASRFRQLLRSPELTFVMEGHDGLSARIVEEAGFEGIWASGLAIASALGVRDCNEASWTQVLDVLEFMSDATSIPILADGDTGYGNFNNVRRLVRKLCDRGVAAVCIEDKLFPKMNSFIGEGQALADIEEFCGRIRAGKDSQTEEDFCLIARTEALISGRGLDEALRRAEAYHAAGADGILVHSKASHAGEVLAFMKEWGDRCPVVLVPTRYYATPTEQFRQAGVSLVVWANHNLRAGITAMRAVSRRLHQEQSLVHIEGSVASLGDIFALVDNAELESAEQRYLPREDGRRGRAIVLATAAGCVQEVASQPLLSRLCGTLFAARVRHVTVVEGPGAPTVPLPSVERLTVEAPGLVSEAAVLASARHLLDGECLLARGDVLVRRHILDRLFEQEGDLVLVVEGQAREYTVSGRVACSRGYASDYLEDGPAVRAQHIGAAVREAQGEWLGLARLSARGAVRVGAILDAMAADGTLATANLSDLVARLLAEGDEVRVLYVSGHWLQADVTPPPVVVMRSAS